MAKWEQEVGPWPAGWRYYKQRVRNTRTGREGYVYGGHGTWRAVGDQEWRARVFYDLPEDQVIPGVRVHEVRFAELVIDLEAIGD